jgi:hypothetical protein
MIQNFFIYIQGGAIKFPMKEPINIPKYKLSDIINPVISISLN